jgi:hypothetical protein
MIHGIHIEVLLAGAYALLLVGIATVLEWVARHSHHRSEHFRNSGFTYQHKHDVWECPAGQHLTREHTDFERKTARYRAPAQKCNACHLKNLCTDSSGGRQLESRLDAWVQSGLNRFHRCISLSLLVLADLFLIAEGFRYGEIRDLLAILILLIPLSFAVSKLLLSLCEPEAKR